MYVCIMYVLLARTVSYFTIYYYSYNFKYRYEVVILAFYYFLQYLWLDWKIWLEVNPTSARDAITSVLSRRSVCNWKAYPTLCAYRFG